MSKAKFGFYDILQDRISKFKGQVVAISHYATGCIHYALQSEKLSKEGKPLDWEYFDESRMDLIKKHEPEKKKPTGGPVNCEVPPN